jgi:hypothetical protein
MHRFSSATVVLAGVALAGCTTVEPVKESSARVPRPDRILVYELAVTPGEVEMDRGLSARLQEAIAGEPRTVAQIEVGRKAAEALAECLVKEIRDMGLPAQHYHGPPPSWGRTVMIKGAFLSIDEGNRTERVVIGLGVGRSDIRAGIEVLEARRDEPPKLLVELDVDAKSGFKPGMAETMGAGAAAGNLAAAAAVSAAGSVGSEVLGAGVDDDARRAARSIAEQLRPFFVHQGWIAE